MERLERFIERVAGVLLAAVAVVTVVEVLLRQGFGLRVPDAYTLAGFLQAIAVMWGIAVAVLAGRHIAVDIAWELATPAWRRRLDLFATASCIVFFAALTWMLAVKVDRTLGSGEATLDLGWPLWPMYSAGLAGSAFAVIAGLLRWRKVARGQGDRA